MKMNHVIVPMTICLLLLGCLSCGEVKYRAGDKLYSRTELLAMQKQKNEAMLSQIAPIEKPVGGSLVVIIPTEELLRQAYGFAGPGSRNDTTRDSGLQFTMNAFSVMVEAVRRRGLFDTVDCRESADPEQETFETDFALIRPAKKETDWLLRTQTSQDATPITYGPPGASPFQWITIWLNNIEDAAGRADGSQPLEATTPAPTPGEDFVTVKVSQKVMKELASWDKEIVFYTSARNPITSLNGLLDNEIAMWGSIGLVKYYQKLFHAVGEPKEREEGYTRVSFIGDVANAFTKSQRRRLFITLGECEDIVKTGGGVRIHFEIGDSAASD